MRRQLTLFDPEAVARDEALDRFEWSRAGLVQRGRELALEIAARHGAVTSTLVLRALRDEAAGDPDLQRKLDEADPRWLGAVFRGGTGWIRAGWAPSGSHKRPVPIWKRVTYDQGVAR